MSFSGWQNLRVHIQTCNHFSAASEPVADIILRRPSIRASLTANCLRDLLQDENLLMEMRHYCALCKQWFQSLRGLSGHLNKDHKPSVDASKTHLASLQSIAEQANPCKFCGTHVQALSKHKCVVLKQIACLQASFELEQSSRLNKHAHASPTQPHGKDPALPNKTCLRNKQVTQQTQSECATLKTKRNADAGSDGPVLCKLCNRSFGTYKGLRIHNSRMHGSQKSAPPNTPEHVCKLCFKSHLTAEDLTHHMNREHIHPAVFACATAPPGLISDRANLGTETDAGSVQDLCLQLRALFLEWIRAEQYEHILTNVAACTVLCHVCQLCRKAYTRPEDLVDHVLSTHKDLTPAASSIFAAVTWWANALRYHSSWKCPCTNRNPFPRQPESHTNSKCPVVIQIAHVRALVQQTLALKQSAPNVTKCFIPKDLRFVMFCTFEVRLLQAYVDFLDTEDLLAKPLCLRWKCLISKEFSRLANLALSNERLSIDVPVHSKTVLPAEEVKHLLSSRCQPSISHFTFLLTRSDHGFSYGRSSHGGGDGVSWAADVSSTTISALEATSSRRQGTFAFTRPFDRDSSNGSTRALSRRCSQRHQSREGVHTFHEPGQWCLGQSHAAGQSKVAGGTQEWQASNGLFAENLVFSPDHRDEGATPTGGAGRKRQPLGRNVAKVSVPGPTETMAVSEMGPTKASPSSHQRSADHHGGSQEHSFSDSQPIARRGIHPSFLCHGPSRSWGKGRWQSNQQQGDPMEAGDWTSEFRRALQSSLSPVPLSPLALGKIRMRPTNQARSNMAVQLQQMLAQRTSHGKSAS